MPALIALLLLYPLMALAGEDKNSRISLTGHDYIYTIDRSSWLTLTGETNVNSFECLSNGERYNGYIRIEGVDSENRINFSNARLSLPVSSFDCKNPLITRDMHKTLGGSNSPEIEIRLVDAYAGKIDGEMSDGNISANIIITINGISRSTSLDIAWSRSESYEYQFTGLADLYMSDFGIDPPSPALGLIRVNDRITVNFNYSVQAGTLSSLE
jgi:hypothetical protein